MHRVLLLLILASLFAGCTSTPQNRSADAPVATVSAEPPFQRSPLTEQTPLGTCGNNVLHAYPGDGTGIAASTLRCTTHYADMQSVLASSDPATTLLVLDIDDTLLTSETFFGSDAWYEWEKSLQAADPAKPRCRFDIIALNYEAGTQRAVEGRSGVDFVNAISLPKLLLTSRSAQYRGATERELAASSYNLPANLLAGTDGISWTDQEANRPDALVSYANGILMVTGHNKGRLLMDLLDRLAKLHHPQTIRRIILLDDGYANVNALHDHVPEKGIEYYGFLYKAIDKKIVVDRTQATAAMKQWQTLIESNYPKRAERWASTDGCGK